MRRLFQTGDEAICRSWTNADWANEHKSSIRLLARPGDYVFHGAPIALMKPPVEGADVAVNFTTALGPQRTSSSDLRFAVRQLVEVAVRALSPGINDPLTAITVIDRPGAALCEITSLHLPSGVWMNEGSSRTGRSTFNDQLLDSMFI